MPIHGLQHMAVASVIIFSCLGAGSGCGEKPAAFEVSAGHYHSCAIDSVGSVQCWGCEGDLPDEGQCDAPDGTYVMVDAGHWNTCAVDQAGSATCWGYGLDGEEPPGGSYLGLAVGDEHACAMDTDGGVVCWGSDSQGQSSPPDP